MLSNITTIFFVLIGLALMLAPSRYLISVAKWDVHAGGHFYRKLGPQAAVKFYRIFGGVILLCIAIIWALSLLGSS